MTLTHTADFTASHTEPLMPRWHACHRIHGHQWSVSLETSSVEDFTDAESVSVRVAFFEFDAWVAAVLDRRHLNEVDAALREQCGPGDVARWVYETWRHRLSHLAAVRVSGPSEETRSPGWPGPPRYDRYEVVHRAPATGGDNPSRARA